MAEVKARDRQGINFYWLLQLRWWALAGQALVVVLVQAFLPLHLPMPALFGLMGIALFSNVGSSWWVRRQPSPSPMAIGLIMAFDVLLLTAMLYLTGGPSNPFSFLYLVHIALAAVVLPFAWTWALVAFAMSCFGLLFVDHVALALSEHAGHDFQHLHLEGMWVAFGVASVFIVYFVQRVTRALAAREAELAMAQRITARNERLASLATLAAGAAHELATPLSTIAVVAKELELELEGKSASSAVLEDAKLIREQVQRCRAILDQMAAEAGESAGESLLASSAEALLESTLAGLPERERIKVSIEDASRTEEATLPLRALAQALRGLVKNALDASPPGSEVRVSVETRDTSWIVKVIDRGAGIPEDVLARAGEPFFTTKTPGTGMGLGLFLARAVLDRLGGRVELSSEVGQGSIATVVLPGVRGVSSTGHG